MGPTVPVPPIKPRLPGSTGKGNEESPQVNFSLLDKSSVDPRKVHIKSNNHPPEQKNFLKSKIKTLATSSVKITETNN